MLRRVVAPYKTKVVRSAGTSSIAKDHLGMLQIIRFDPTTNSQEVQTFEFEKKQDFMVLDLLTAVKAHQDPTLAFRASCCEGVCGSCAMNINGVNSLACVTYAAQHTIVGPLPNFPVTKDLVVDLRGFFRQYEFIRPFVRNVNLPRYHVDSMVERYESTCKALFGKDTSLISADHSKSNFHASSKLEAYRAMLDKVVAVGDVTAAVEILGRVQDMGIELDNEEVKKVLKQAVANHKK